MDFQLIATDERGQDKKSQKIFLSGIQEFVYGVNHHLMGYLCLYPMKKFAGLTKLEKINGESKISAEI